jgi:predicted house-cleaning noncanonical NTP pyrophosphatase (MazG superfamily)
MNLFELTSEYKVQINPAAYTLSHFKKIWDRDKSKAKETAQAELAFVYFTCDYKSDFYNIPETETREIEVIKHCIKDTKWKPDKVVRDAQEFYKDRQKTFSLILLEDAVHGISKLSSYLRDINFEENEINERTGEIKPKHDIKKYADTIKTIPDILKALNSLEEAVKKEQQQKNSLRGGREKGLYVD